MSTREDLAAQLRTAERGEAAGWVAWSEGPSWLPAALGVSTALVAPAWVVALAAAATTTTVTWTYGAAYAADADRVRRRLDGPA